MKPPMQNGSAPEWIVTAEQKMLPPCSATQHTRMGGWDMEPALLALFEERARKLAIPIEQQDDQSTSRKVLVFRLGEERFAIDSQFVIEVHTATHITPIPGSAAWWLGLVNLRGRLYSVLDLGRWLTHKGLHTTSDIAGSPGELVLVRAAHQTLALYTNEVQAVRQLTDAELRPPIANDHDSEQPSAQGMTDDLIVLLDAETIFREVKRQTQAASLAV